MQVFPNQPMLGGFKLWQPKQPTPPQNQLRQPLAGISKTPYQPQQPTFVSPTVPPQPNTSPLPQTYTNAYTTPTGLQLPEVGSIQQPQYPAQVGSIQQPQQPAWVGSIQQPQQPQREWQPPRYGYGMPPGQYFSIPRNNAYEMPYGGYQIPSYGSGTQYGTIGSIASGWMNPTGLPKSPYDELYRRMLRR